MSSVVKIPTPLVSCGAWVSEAIARASELRGSSLSGSMVTLTSEALAVWKKLLFPTPRLEEWKYTNPEQIAQGPFVFGRQAEAPRAEVEELLRSARIPDLAPSAEMVFVDGVFTPELSVVTPVNGLSISRVSDNGVGSDRVGSLGLHREEAFAALATALFSDAVVISVDRGVAVAAPIHVITITSSAFDGCVGTPRVFVSAKENAEVRVIESHVGKEGVRYLSLPILEIQAAEGAIVDHYRIQQESKAAFQISGAVLDQHKSATVRSHIFSFGASLARNNVTMNLRGAGGQGVLNGLSLLSDEQHVDNATVIHHQQPSIESREHFKGVYAGKSRGVFSGTITVDKIAQKTNAFQSNQALLLSSEASIESRPQLKIWADDVKCTHGATVGQLDSDAMFYLRSRGISREEARAFLVHAFASEVLASVTVEAVKQYVEGVLSEKLEGISGVV